MISIEPYFKWYDLWVGIYIKLDKRTISSWPSGFEIFIGLFPSIGIRISIYYKPYWKKDINHEPTRIVSGNPSGI